MNNPFQMNGIFFEPEFLDPLSSWTEHIPFASAFIRMLRPKLLVELGVYQGASYLTFCQIIREAQITCNCYGVDTWKGDSQTGYYQEKLFRDINEKNKRFENFSSLMQMSFNEASRYFSEATIDFLHIDGLHTYEAVAEDFTVWRPKLSNKSVILFHDTIIRRDDFGVWKLWNEIKNYGPSFEFPFGCGLGVLALGDHVSDEILSFIQKLNNEPNLILYFEKLGLGLATKAKNIGLQQNIDELEADVKKTLSVINDMTKENDNKTEHIKNLDTLIGELNENISVITSVRNELENQKGQLIIQYDEKIAGLNDDIITLQEFKDKYDGLMSSDTICFVLKCFSVRDKLLPLNSRRRMLLKLIYLFVTHPLRFIKKIRLKTILGLFSVLVRGNIQLFKDRLRYHFENNTIPYPGYVNPLSLVDVSGPAKFKQSEDPILSVLIPAYNQYEHTKATLFSLAQHANEIKMEVLLLDDASPDKRIAQLEDEFPGLIYKRNATNLGFLGNINSGAEQAKGKFVYLLNNDVLLQSGTIKALLGTFDSHPEAGAAGSKLVFPDGKLQEAGGIVWADGSAWNFGRGDDPEKPQYNYLKEVDYVSGASLMIRRKDWETLGGFDNFFSPAYAEDTDLAFSLRSQKRKVFYQPKSVLLHFEGVSHGVDEKAGLKACQAANLEKLSKKWASILRAEHYPNGQDVFLARDRSGSRRHILFVDHYVPQPDRDAGSRSTCLYLNLLTEMGFMIHFLPDNRHRDPDYTDWLEQKGIEVLYNTRNSSFDLKQWLKENGKYIEISILSRPHIAIQYIDDIKKYTKCKKIIYFAHDLQHISLERKFSLTKNPKDLEIAKKFRSYEHRLTKDTDSTWVFSNFEAQYLKDNGFTDAVYEIPLFFYKNIPVEEPRPFKERDKAICFVAGFRHPPNADAVRWFSHEVWPLVREMAPGASFLIAGDYAPDELKEIAGIELLGSIPDEALEELYQKTRAAVVPLRYGAGLKGKVIEPLCRALPVVGTSIAAEGAEGLDDVVAVSDDPDSMARDIVHILNDPNVWENMSKKSLEFMRKRFTKKVAERRMRELLG